MSSPFLGEIRAFGFNFAPKGWTMCNGQQLSIQQNAARTGDQIVSRNLNVQPTLRVRPGWPLRVLISKDLVLKPWVRDR